MSEQGRSGDGNGSGSLSARQREEQAERMAVVEPVSRGPRRRRRRRAALISAGVLLVLVGAAPTLVGLLGRGIVESRLSGALGSGVRIERLGLSWWGDQRVRSLRIVDGSLREAADVDVRLERSLFGLLLGRKDLGEVVVSGSMTLDAGQGPLADLLARMNDESEVSSEPGKLPAGLRVGVRAEGLDVLYRDAEGEEFRAEGITGTARLGEGGTVSVDLAADLSQDNWQGRATIDADAVGLVDASGVLTPERLVAKGVARLEGERSPVGGFVDAGLGTGAYTSRLEFSSSWERGEASVVYDSPSAALALPMAFRREGKLVRVSSAGEGTLRADASVVERFVPALAELAETPLVLESGQVVELSALSGVSAALREFSIDVSTEGSGVDLGSLVLRGRLETGELGGTLDAQAWSVEPMSVDVTTQGVTRGLSVQAVTTAQLGGKPAGVFVVNAEASELFDESGALPGDELLSRLLAGLRGGVEINDVEGALLDSLAGVWLQRAGVSVVEDLGDRVDAEIAFEGGAERALRVFLRSERMRGSAGFVIDGGVIRGDGAGVRFEADSAAALVTRQLGLDGVTLTEGGRAELWVRDIVVDLDRLGGAEGAPDLRSVRGHAELRLEPMTGTIVLGGVEQKLWVSASAVSVDALDIAAGAGLAGAVTLRVDDQAAGDLSLSVRATDVVDEVGRLRAGLPTVEGELALRGAMTSLAQPMAAQAGLVLGEDLGETLDVLARATVNAEGVVGVRMDVTSEHLTGAGELEIVDRSLRSVGPGLSVELSRAGGVLGRFLPEGVIAAEGGTLGIASESFVLAMGDSGLDWSRTTLDARLSARDMWVSEPGGENLHAERLDVGLSLNGASGAGSAELSGVVTVSGEPMPLGGRLDVTELVREGVLSRDAARLDGRFDFGQVPIVPARRPAEASPTPGRDLAAELFGRLLDVWLVADGQTGSLELGVRGERLEGSVRAERGALGGGDLRITGGELRSEISPEVMEQMRLRAGQEAGVAGPVGARFVEPARVELSFEEFGLFEDWLLTPTGTPGVRLVASGMVEGLPLTREGEQVSSGPIGIEELVVEGRVPIGSLFGEGTSSVSLAVSGEVTTLEGSIGSVVGGFDVGLAGGRTSGELRGDLSVTGVDAALLDDVAVLGGLLPGLVGAKLDAQMAFSGQAVAGVVGDLGAELTLSSPRLSTPEAVRLTVKPASIEVAPGARLDWRIAPEVATRHVLSQPVGAERVRVMEDVDLSFVVSRLVVSRGTGPVLPGVFAVDVAMSAPKVRVVVPRESQGAEPVVHAYEPLSLRVQGDAARVSIEGLAQPQSAERQPLTLSAHLTSFGDEQGRWLAERATIDGELRVTDAPSAMIDGLLSQDGLLAEALGPETSFVATTEGLHSGEGTLTAVMESTRSSGRMVAKMFEGRLIAVEPVVITLREVRPELGLFLGEAVPVIGTVTKRPEDGPAKLTINTMELPVLRLSELSRLQDLDIEAVVDLGTARFDTSSLFTRVMKATGQRSQGALGRRMSPIAITINSGVLTYPRTSIPVGEYTIESVGQIRLTDGYIDVVTYVPMAALTEEALGLLKTGVLSAISRNVPLLESATMVPWRTRGLPGQIKLSADTDLLLQNVGNTLNPLDLINSGLESLQGLSFDRPKKKESK